MAAAGLLGCLVCGHISEGQPDELCSHGDGFLAQVLDRGPDDTGFDFVTMAIYTRSQSHLLPFISREYRERDPEWWVRTLSDGMLLEVFVHRGEG